MGPLEVLKSVTQVFEKAGIDYFLVGSLASMYYSRPRFTNDIDLIVQIKTHHIQSFETLFNQNEYYCPPTETIQDEFLRGGMFNLVHHQSGIKIDIIILNTTPFYQSEFERRRKVELLPDFETYIASPEDIILKKLDYYREGGSEKHLLDIRGILIETKVDHTYLQEWIGKLGLTAQWNKVG